MNTLNYLPTWFKAATTLEKLPTPTHGYIKHSYKVKVQQIDELVIEMCDFITYTLA